MKLQEILVDFFYKEKYLTLQGIGIFKLDPNINVFSKEDAHLFKQSITFEYDPRTVEDSALITFITVHTGKMKSLASSDLESFLDTGIQLINIGKPFVIPGLGAISRNKTGLEFIASNSVFHALDEKNPENKFADKTIHSNEQEKEEMNYSFTEKKQKYTYKRWLSIIGVVLLLAIAGWIVNNFIEKKKNTTVEENIQVVNDTPLTISKLPDTNSAPVLKDTSATQLTALLDTGLVEYNIILHETQDKKFALYRFNKLITGKNNVLLQTKDSTFFRLIMPWKGLLSDTARVRDSIANFFAVKARLEFK